MNIALLSVGTEILLGDTVNTNLASLGQALYNNGFILSTEKTVPDDKKLIQDAVNELLENNDVIITCGGIGPTEDDFTKEVISEMFDLKLVVDEDHLSWMKSRWESFAYIMLVFLILGLVSQKILWTSARRLYLKLGVMKPLLYSKTARLLVS